MHFIRVSKEKAIQEISHYLGPEIALLPVGGLFTMNVKEAVRSAELIKPQVVIPMHYGFIPGTNGAGRKFAKLWLWVTKDLTPV